MIRSVCGRSSSLCQKPYIVVDQIDPGAAVGHLVGPNHLVQVYAHLGRGVGQGDVNDPGVFFQAAPVTLVGKRFAPRDPHCGEDAPTADQSGLAGREPHLLDGLQFVVVEDVTVNQCVPSCRRLAQ